MPWTDDLALVDHHCHSVARDEPDVRSLLTEAPAPVADPFDSAVGLSVRRWCAPLLDLAPHAPPADYLARRLELGGDEVTRRLLRAAGTDTMLVDTGLGENLLGLDELADAAGARTRQVLRLETVAEAVEPEALPAAVAHRARDAVATKSVLAYRHGFDIDPSRPSHAEVRAAAARWQPGARLTDPVLLRHALWAGVDTGLPLQLHTGFGDPDEDLHRANPALLAGFCRATEHTKTPVMLLHCYPYHREAAWLAHVFAHVYVDVSLASSYVGGRATQLLAEALELAPFAKVLYASDGYGLAELHLLGAVRFRRALAGVLDGWHRDGEISAADTRRVAEMLASGNARRVYGL